MSNIKEAFRAVAALMSGSFLLYVMAVTLNPTTTADLVTLAIFLIAVAIIITVLVIVEAVKGSL